MTTYKPTHEQTLHLLPGIPGCTNKTIFKAALKRFNKPVVEATTPFVPIFNSRQPVEICFDGDVKWYMILNTFGN